MRDLSILEEWEQTNRVIRFLGRARNYCFHRYTHLGPSLTTWQPRSLKEAMDILEAALCKVKADGIGEV